MNLQFFMYLLFSSVWVEIRTRMLFLSIPTYKSNKTETLLSDYITSTKLILRWRCSNAGWTLRQVLAEYKERRRFVEQLRSSLLVCKLVPTAHFHIGDALCGWRCLPW